MRISKKEKGRIVDQDVREVEEFAFTVDKMLKCSWCGRPYKYPAIPIESMLSFGCIPGCEKITRKTTPVTRKCERIWDGKQYKWELIDVIQEALGAEVTIKIDEKKTRGPLETLALPRIIASLKQTNELAQPDLL